MVSLEECKVVSIPSDTSLMELINGELINISREVCVSLFNICTLFKDDYLNKLEISFIKDLFQKKGDGLDPLKCLIPLQHLS